MSSDFQILCDHIDDEIERQQNVGAVCTAQHEASCAREAVAIDARNHPLELLAQDANSGAGVRNETIAGLVILSP